MGYVLGTQYPANKIQMDTKIRQLQKLLPPTQLLPSEWEVIGAFLKDAVEEKETEGDHETPSINKVASYIGDGFMSVEKWFTDLPPRFYSDTGWEYPEPTVETVNIRDLDVDPSFVRDLLIDTESRDKDTVSNAIMELQNHFLTAALNY